MRKFELRRDGRIVATFEAAFTECHRRGDELATRLGDVECYVYNAVIRQWEKMGVYHGQRRFTDSFGEDCVLKHDYSGMFLKPERKEVKL